MSAGKGSYVGSGARSVRFRDGKRERKVRREKEEKDHPEAVCPQKKRETELFYCN
jgi:hypothetical protein